MKKTCNYCGDLIIGRQKTAKYCNDNCRLRAFRERNRALMSESREDYHRGRERALKQLKITRVKVKSSACCENACLYSPAFRWGEILICDNCKAVWGRLDEPSKGNEQNSTGKTEKK